MKNELQPRDLTLDEWDSCLDFAFQFAKQQGFYEDINSYKQIKKSASWGESVFNQGLNIAVISCRFWRTFYKKRDADQKEQEEIENSPA